MGAIKNLFHAGKTELKDKRGKSYWVDKGTEDQYVATYGGVLKREVYYAYTDLFTQKVVKLKGWELALKEEEQWNEYEKQLHDCCSDEGRRKWIASDEYIEQAISGYVNHFGYSHEDAVKRAKEAQRELLDSLR